MAIPLKTQPQPQPLSDLNMTPLIDVLLVLLVMFIITMPLQTHAVRIDLPNGPAPTTLHPDSVRNRITIDAAGTIAWNGQTIDRPGLRTLLAQSMAIPVEPALDLKPTADARFEVVDAVMVDIKRSGVTKLGLPGNEAYQAF